jgi:hypothetical protein
MSLGHLNPSMKIRYVVSPAIRSTFTYLPKSILVLREPTESSLLTSVYSAQQLILQYFLTEIQAAHVTQEFHWVSFPSSSPRMVLDGYLFKF